MVWNEWARNWDIPQQVSFDPSNKSLTAMDHDFGANNKTLLTFNDGTKIAASMVLACDGTFSTVRTLQSDTATGTINATKPFLIDEQKTVWRGTAPNINTRGMSTFYIAQDEANVKGATANIFPAGRTTDGSSLSIIMPTSLPGRATGSEDARQRLKQALASLDVPIEPALLEAVEDVDYMLEYVRGL